MISEAILEYSKWQKGSSRQAIIKYIAANYNVAEDAIKSHMGTAIKRMLDDDCLLKVKGSYKLAPKWRDEYRKKSGRKSVAASPKKKKRKARQVKDKDAPKGPSSGWVLYMKDTRPGLKKKYPDEKSTDLVKRMGKKWKNLSDEERKPYLELGEEEKKRYKKAMKKYERKKKKEVSSSSASSSSAESSESESESESKEKEKQKKEKQKRDKEKREKEKEKEKKEKEEKEKKGKGAEEKVKGKDEKVKGTEKEKVKGKDEKGKGKDDMENSELSKTPEKDAKGKAKDSKVKEPSKKGKTDIV